MVYDEVVSIGSLTVGLEKSGIKQIHETFGMAQSTIKIKIYTNFNDIDIR